MKRFKHSLSHYKLVTCNMGELVPVGLIEALPGDTFQQSTSMLVRMSPLMAPVMHPVSVRLHHWFVPNRINYPGWENFITGGPDGFNVGADYPKNVSPITPLPGSLLDYMGVPIGKTFGAGEIGLLPLRAYNKIFNEFYRDEDLVPEVTQDQTVVQKVAWEKDYFTTARPWTQKGPEITLPITGDVTLTGGQITPQPAKPTFKFPGGSATQFNSGVSGNSDLVIGTMSAGQQAYEWADPGLDVTGMNGTLVNSDIPIIDVRRAFALQRYEEARAQYGSRYSEYLRYLGVRSSDARLQRPEYLGGGKQTIAFSEVLRTGSAVDEATNPIGEMKGHGIAAMRSNRYRYFCEEHGYILTLLSIRPRSMYVDGLDKTWSRRSKEDYYQKELELIGQKEIFNRELYADGSAADAQIFGYQDRYSEYRHQYSGVTGEFRNILDYWHMARKFASLPVLNKSFIECDPTKRVFAEQTQNSAWIMVSHSIQARRMVGKKTIGRVI